MAADPSVGTWKLNIAKSKMPPSAQAPPKEETQVVQEVGDEMQVTVTGVRTDGSAISDKHSSSKNGGLVTFQKGAPPAGYSAIYTLIAPGDSYTTILQDGKQIAVVHAVVSKDGKTNRWTITGMDAQGKPIEGLEIWDRQ
jgi:archaellum component FlaF (FlaF/FlaG flagellin family)